VANYKVYLDLAEISGVQRLMIYTLTNTLMLPALLGR